MYVYIYIYIYIYIAPGAQRAVPERAGGGRARFGVGNFTSQNRGRTEAELPLFFKCIIRREGRREEGGTEAEQKQNRGSFFHRDF